jgi:hypothetical protein
MSHVWGRLISPVNDRTGQRAAGPLPRLLLRSLEQYRGAEARRQDAEGEVLLLAGQLE